MTTVEEGATWPPITAVPAVTFTESPLPAEGTRPETMPGPRSPNVASINTQLVLRSVASAIAPFTWAISSAISDPCQASILGAHLHPITAHRINPSRHQFARGSELRRYRLQPDIRLHSDCCPVYKALAEVTASLQHQRLKRIYVEVIG